MDPYVERSLVSGGLLVPSLYTSHIVYVFLKVYDFDCSSYIPPPRWAPDVVEGLGEFWERMGVVGGGCGGGGVGVGDGEVRLDG